jgi:hypothetical protein
MAKKVTRRSGDQAVGYQDNRVSGRILCQDSKI